MITNTAEPAADRALVGLAVGRIVLGALALATPGRTARLFGTRPNPELNYLSRIFGGRAVALGLGYLTEPPEHRPRWHRLGLFVDTADTLTALVHLRRRDLPRRAALAAGALTGSYMLVGALRLLAARTEAEAESAATPGEPPRNVRR